tara:strand:- start:967 stop:1680 length:714 start_codon:yes stop_codon:yes gene_type:complete
MEVFFIFLLIIIISVLGLNKKLIESVTKNIENFRNRHIKYCDDPDYDEWRPSLNNNQYYRGVVSSRYYRPFSSNKNECRTKFEADSNNYNNLDFFTIIYEAWLFSSKNKVSSSLKNEFYRLLKKTLEIACKITGAEKYEFTKKDLENCIKNFDKGPDSFLVYHLLTETSKICKKKHRPVALCKSFENSIEQTVQIARKVRSNIKFVSRNYRNQSNFGNIWYDGVVRNNNDINRKYGN